MDNTTIIGASGALIILIGFLLNQKNIWKNSDIRYDLMNFIGSVFLIAYSLMISSWPFLILNAVWAGISLSDIFKDLSKKKIEQEP